MNLIMTVLSGLKIHESMNMLGSNMLTFLFLFGVKIIFIEQLNVHCKFALTKLNVFCSLCSNYLTTKILDRFSSNNVVTAHGRCLANRKKNCRCSFLETY